MTVTDRFRLDGHVTLVTGAAAGIGRGIARLFAEAGSAVVAADLKGEGAESVAAEIKAAGGRAIGLACNVTREDDLSAAVDAAASNFGKLTVLVNNAGGGGPKPFDMPMGDFEWAYQLNVFSLFRLTQLAAPHMKAAGGGAVLNISAMADENKNSGGAQNIGAGVARTLSGAGARVMIADLNGDMARETAAAIQKDTGNDCRGIRCDVTSLDDIDAVVAETVGAFGGISTLVNNVG